VNKKSDLLKISAKYLKLNDTYFKQLFKIGLPIIVENCCIAGVITFEVFIANYSGIIGSAAYGVISKLEQVVIVIGGSFKSIATVTVGQFIGKNKIKDSVHVFYDGLKLIIVPTFLIALIVFVFPRTFINIFVNSEKVIDLAVIYLSVVGFAHVLLPTRQFLNGFIVGTGHTFVTFSSAIIASICELILIFILRNNHVDNLKALGFGILTWVITEMTINLFYYLSNKWKKEVIKKEVIC
jgi:Na+-driven multidrug efflux pump